MKPYNYIVIEGNIGAGKTTLAKMLSGRFDARLVLERYYDNPFLPKFYSSPEKYSFHLELSFLAERYSQLNKELNDRDLFQPLTLSDYYFMKSLIFSRATLTEDEFKLYRQVFDIINTNIVKPDLYIYLHLSLDNLMRNIKSRGRYFEQNIQKEYLVKIQEGYMDFFRHQKDLTIVMIDINEIDFIHKQADLDKLIEVIFSREYAPGINKVVP
jgi:deoxyadenosine/deoxycytidine kinase